MPAVDATKTASRTTVRTLNKGRAKRVRTAKKYLTTPVAGPKPAAPVRAPQGQVDRGGAAAQQAAAKNYTLSEAKKLTTGKHRTLHKQEVTIHELARLGVLPKGYLSGIAGRAADARARADKLEAEAQKRVDAVGTIGRALGSGDEALGPPVPYHTPKILGPSLPSRRNAYQEHLKTPEGQKAYLDNLRETDPSLKGKSDKEVVTEIATRETKSNKPSALQSAISGIPAGLVRSAGALVEGTVRDPIGVPTKTAKQGALAVSAIPAGVVGLAVHPKQTAEAMVADYAKRNNETYDEKLKRVRAEGGFAEASDIATALSLGGGAAAKAALIRNAPERAAKLLSGGAKHTPKKGGPVRYGIGTAVDKRKAAKYEKIALKTEARAGTTRPGVRMTKTGPRLVQKPVGLTALQHEALQANRAAGRVVAVVPRRSGRKIANVVANARGKAVAGLKYDSAKGSFAALAKEKYNLNKDEAAALWLGTEVGIRDAATARTVATKLRDKMAAERGDYTPTGWERDMDVIAQIDHILKDPEKHFTPRFAEVMDRVHEHAQAISDLEPQFKDQTKENRRRAAQVYALDLHQGVIDEPAGTQWSFTPPPRSRAATARPDFVDGRLVALPDAPIEGQLQLPRGPLVPGERAAVGGTDLARTPPAPDFLNHAGFYEERPTLPNLRYKDETDAEFNARIDETAAKAGLSAPTYFRSEKQQGLTSDYGARVVGGTTKSTGKQYLGKNLGQGIFDTTYEQFVRGYAHNLKATHNYPLIAKLDDKNRLRSFSPDSEPQGAELGELMNRVNRAEPRLQKGSVVFVNKGLFERELDNRPDTTDPESRAGDDAAVRDALDKAVVREDGVTPELARTPGWVAWPVEADRELQAELHAGTVGGRMFDIAKGTASKAILLTGNLPWIALQTASETATVGLASKGRALTPRNMLGTARMWKAMNHRQRTHVATELGLGATGSDTAAIKLGATTNNGMINAWRDLKAADFWHRPRALAGGAPVAAVISPVKWMRAADQGKTNVTRLLLAHHELTKKISPEGQAALASSLEHMAKFGKDADRLLPIMAKPSAEQLDHLFAHPELLERMGENVSNALGDWTTMTAKERTWANRFVMFYPFMRYSTRLLFHTLPVDHPAVTSALAELGQLTAEEYRSVFGDDDLPWNIGKVYFGKTGESKYIDLTRANPALNAAVGAAARLGSNSENIPGAVTGMLPPYFQWAVDQATGVNTFKARPLRFNGDTDPFWNKPTDISAADRGQLLLAQIQSLFYPTREAMTRTHPDAQSDESSLLFPTPMKYKTSKEIKGNSEDAKIRRASARAAEKTQAFNDQNDGGLADLLVGPLAPRASRDAAAAKDREYIKKLKDAQAKKAAERKRYRDTHGGKNKTKPKYGGNSGFGGKSGNSGF